MTNSATVNPMPDSAAPPISWPQRRVSGMRPIPVRRATQVPAVTPTSLPTVSPTMIPHVIGEVAAAARLSLVSGTPALASTNSGTIT